MDDDMKFKYIDVVELVSQRKEDAAIEKNRLGEYYGKYYGFSLKQPYTLKEIEDYESYMYYF
jgi:hypothetical protein